MLCQKKMSMKNVNTFLLSKMCESHYGYRGVYRMFAFLYGMYRHVFILFQCLLSVTCHSLKLLHDSFNLQ